jgi:hypothetical protein
VHAMADGTDQGDVNKSRLDGSGLGDGQYVMGFNEPLAEQATAAASRRHTIDWLWQRSAGSPARRLRSGPHLRSQVGSGSGAQPQPSAHCYFDQPITQTPNPSACKVSLVRARSTPGRLHGADRISSTVSMSHFGSIRQ